MINTVKSFLVDQLIPFLLVIPSQNQSELYQLGTTDKCNKKKTFIFNKRGLHLIHLNISSVLSKIDELCVIAKKSRASVIGITESKLDKPALDKETNIDVYELSGSDRNRHGGGVACCIQNDRNVSVRDDFSSEIEILVFPLILQSTF